MTLTSVTTRIASACLVQRINAFKRLVFSCSIPVIRQLGLVHRRPFKNQTLCSPWQFTLEHSNRVDTNESSVLAVDGMEVGWIMFEVKHSDHDPVEFGYSWHVPPLPGESTRSEERRVGEECRS